MPKKYLGINVLRAAQERISLTFDNFKKIYVAFSGGKDSTVMLHLVMDEAIKRKRKVAVCFIDLEGQYKLTINHIEKCFNLYQENIEKYWICLPIHLRNSVSVYETHWICWDKEKKDAWIRNPPQDAILDENYFLFFHKGMEFEEFVPEFGEWYSENQPCACFVGIRTDESLNRFRALANQMKTTFDDKQWTTLIKTKPVDNHVYNIYPIYDWKTSDIWIYHAKNKDKPYNKLYDYMHKAGLTPHQMRICQPYGDDQRKGLWLFHLIEPETWAKVVTRVNGANGGALYVQEWGNINGYRKITKPPGHTWQSFAYLFLNSLPPKTKEHFGNKIATFCKWWMEHGYPEGIPDAAPYELEAKRKAPSWRRICKSLLRNDYWCKGIGFSQTKSDAYKKYLNLKKRKREEWGMNEDLLFKKVSSNVEEISKESAIEKLKYYREKRGLPPREI
jgi:predicted phosphoadenosine phosphosulfate sulfurtransferase